MKKLQKLYSAKKNVKCEISKKKKALLGME